MRIGRKLSQTPRRRARSLPTAPAHRNRRTPASARPKTPTRAFSFEFLPVLPFLNRTPPPIPLRRLCPATGAGCSAPALRRPPPSPESFLVASQLLRLFHWQGHCHSHSAAIILHAQLAIPSIQAF